MTLEKAKELLAEHTHYAYQVKNSDLIYALRLGSEALNYIKICQKNPNCFNISFIPGQTKE